MLPSLHSCAQGECSFARFPEGFIPASRQGTNNYNGKIHSSVEAGQQTNEFLETESLESSKLNVRHARLVHAKHVCCNKLVQPSDIGENRLPKLLL
jgi:hypothetical protein